MAGARGPQGLFRNTLSYFLTIATGYLLSLLLAPLMLSRLGLAQFGVWVLSGGLAIYFGLADFGVRRSLSRFVALYDSRGDERAIAELFTLGLIGAALVSGLAAGAAVVVAPLYHDQLGVLGEGDMRLVMLASAVIFTGETLGGVCSAVAVGHRRMVPPNVAQLVNYFLNFAFSVAALLLSRDLVDYALANAAAAVLSIGISAAAMLTVWRARLAVPSRARVREVLGFGVKTQLGMLADLVNLSTDRVILGLSVSASAAATYEIAARAVLAVRALADASVWAMIPTVTAEIALRGRQMIPAFFHRYTRMTVALVSPLFAGACVTAPFLFVAWLDQLPEDVVGVVLILSVAYWVNLGTGVAGAIVAADGRVGLSARYMVLGALLNICATAAAAPVFGYYGVVAATGIAITAASVAFLVHFHRAYGLDLAACWRAIAPPALLAVGLAAPIAMVAVLWPLPDDRWHALPPLAVTGGMYGVAYWVFASRMRLLPERLSLRRARKAPRSASPTS